MTGGEMGSSDADRVTYLRALLFDWHCREYHSPRKIDEKVFKRVGKLLQKGWDKDLPYSEYLKAYLEVKELYNRPNLDWDRGIF
jgi:hypothetical protein